MTANMSISLEDQARAVLARAGVRYSEEYSAGALAEIVALLKSEGQQLDPRINELAKSNNAVYGSLHVLLSQGATTLEMTVQVALILNAQCEAYRKLCMDMAAGIPK
jgi:hypothetical protein